MKKGLIFALFLFCGGMVYGASEDNRPLGALPSRAIPFQVDDDYVIRFSTTVPANTDVNIVPDHWIWYGASMTWTSGVTYSTSPAHNNGGRMWVGFQAIEAATQGDTGQKLHWSFNTTVSTNTDPYITQGQWFPPTDWPFIYQGTITVRSTATFKIGGIIVTEKRRVD